MIVTAQQYISNDKDQNTYVSVFKYYSSKSDKRVYKEGDLYGLVYLSGSKGIPAERVVKFVWDGIVDGYVYSNSESTNESLKSAIKEGLRKIKDLIRNDKELEESGVNVSFSIVAHRKEGFYVANLGENDIYVYRDNKLINIVDVLEKNKAQTAGLALKDGEVMMISTPTLLNDGISNFMGLVNIEDIKRAVKNFGGNLTNSESLLVLYIEKDNRKKDESKEQVLRINPFIKNIQKEKIVKENVLISNEDKVVKKKGFDFKRIFFVLKNSIDTVIKKIQPIFFKVGYFIKKIIKELGFKINNWLGKKRWFKKLVAKVSQKMPTIKSNVVSPKGLRIDGYRQKDIRTKRFKLVGIVIFVIVLLSLGINFTLNAKKAREIHFTANAILTESEDLLNKTESSIATNKDTAETYLYQIQKKLEGLPEGMNEEDMARANEVKGYALKLEDDLYKRVGVKDDDGSLTTFIDSRLSFGEGSVPTDIEIYNDDSGGEYLLISDSGLKSVFRVSLYDKDVKKLPDNDGIFVSPKHISVGNSGIFVFDSKKGVLKSGFDNDWFKSVNTLSGLEIEDINSEDISEFIVLTEVDNVYFLAKDKASILKSGFSYENSYNLTYSYINNEAFASASDILSDLSVYVLNGSLIRYNYSYIEQAQVEAPVTVSGYSGDLGNLNKGYTRSSLDYGLYLFDDSEKRLFKFEKPHEGGGQILHPDQILLEKQYVYRGSKKNVWSELKDFVVDNDESNMYILDGSTIWKVKL